MSRSRAGASLEPVRRFEVFTGEGRRRKWTLADHRAVIASMTETCKLNGIDPQSWLTARHSNLRRDELMPWDYDPAAG
jgi:hypothetical protein